MFINTCLFINSLLQIRPKDYNHIINQHTDKETKQTKKTHANQKNNHIQTSFQDIVFFVFFWFVCFFVFPYFRTRIIQVISLAFPVKICLLSLGKHGGLALSGHAAFLLRNMCHYKS